MVSIVRRRIFWSGLFLLCLCTITDPQVASAQASDQFVALQTNKGRIIVRVYRTLMPYTAENFLDLVERGFYDGLTFHRVENWVVQGGDPNGNGSGSFIDPDSGRPRLLKLEINQRLNHNQPGMVAMARSRAPNSASCQFYILKRSMPMLNGQYAVFGRVVQGMNVVYATTIGDRILKAAIIESGAGGSNNGLSSNQQAVPGVEDAPGTVPVDTIKLPPGESGF